MAYHIGQNKSLEVPRNKGFSRYFEGSFFQLKAGLEPFVISLKARTVDTFLIPYGKSVANIKIE